MRKMYNLLAVFLVSALMVASVSAVGGKYFNNQDERQELIDAIEAQDYDTWRSIIESQITEENFEEISEYHNNREFYRDTRQLTRDAIAENDYDAYIEAANLSGIENAMTKNDFKTLVELHTKRQAESLSQYGFRQTESFERHGEFNRRMHR